MISRYVLPAYAKRVECTEVYVSSQIMKAYESSTATLREVLAHPLLQREKIDETMDAMAAANADAREVQDAIQLGAEMAQGDAGVDDADLEAELAALAQQVEDEKALARDQQLGAPELRSPTHTPTSPTESDKEGEKVPVAL